MKTPPTVGEILLYPSQKYSSQRENPITFQRMAVTKVGRKFFYALPVGWDDPADTRRFEIETWDFNSPDGYSGSTAVRTEQEHLDNQETARKARKLAGYREKLACAFDSWFMAKLSTERLEELFTEVHPGESLPEGKP